MERTLHIIYPQQNRVYIIWDVLCILYIVNITKRNKTVCIFYGMYFAYAYTQHDKAQQNGLYILWGALGI